MGRGDDEDRGTLPSPVSRLPAGQITGEGIGDLITRAAVRAHGGWADGSASLAAYFEEAGIWDETNPLYGNGL
ncbi:hypothetical protein ACIQMR_31390 [Streptomyces sp. NPDC091376]|uniref:hypothetical protein n=1 Tax=Streptomyces sp. NPDC091376 TaxID=3365994 RepID=UPI003820D4CE